MNLVRRSRSLLKGRGLVLCFALAAALLASAPAAAWAQTVSYMTPTVNRTPDGGTDVRTGNETTLYYISHDDCVNNQAFVFPMSLSTTAGFQIYGSENADCSSTTSRGTLLGQTGPEYCNPLPQHYNPTTGDLTIYAQELVQGVLFTDCDGNSIGGTTSTTASTSSTSSGAGGGSTFSSSSSITSSGFVSTGVNVQVFFTFDTNSDTSCLPSSSTSTSSSGSTTTGVTSGICASWVTQVLLVPPTPPTGLSLNYGDGELIVNIPSTSAVNSSGGYYVFCAPETGASTSGSTSSSSSSSSGSPGTTTSSSSSSSSSSVSSTTSSSSSSSSATSATSSATSTTSSSSSASNSSSSAAGTGGVSGVGGAGGGSGVGGGSGLGGAGGAGANSNLCPSGTSFPIDISQPNVYSSSITPYICAGPIQYSASTVSLQMLGDGGPLQDNVQYVVGVSAYDEVYNIGPPSALMCASPQQTNTFLKTYCSDGGPGCGGCGSCNVGSSNDPLWPMLGLAALGGVAVIVRRDKRKRRRRAGL